MTFTDTAERPMLDDDRLKSAIRSWRFDCGAELRRRRIERTWSQERLASLIGVQPNAISRFEMGLVTPRDGTRVAIACALNCEVNDIWPPMERRYVLALARAV
jgi:transcriptional regulator with XRE-family HTH domain